LMCCSGESILAFFFKIVVEGKNCQKGKNNDVFHEENSFFLVMMGRVYDNPDIYPNLLK